MSTTPGWLPLAFSLFSSMTILVAVASTMRAFLHAKTSSSQAYKLRRQAVAHWVAAVLVNVVLMVVRTRLDGPKSAGARRDAVSIPWRGIALAGAGLIVAAGLLAAALVLLRVWRGRRERLRKAQSAHEAVQGRLESVAARHDVVMEEYGSALLDFAAALERPALFDSSFAATARFDRARIDADDARIALRISGDAEHLERCHQAVTELEVSWRGAQDHARRLGTSHLEPVVARHLATAVGLVAVVQGAASKTEKALAYERIRKIRRQIGSAVRIPQQAELAITRMARPSLTAATDTARP
ncbi:hypothetical protein [Streptomyces sp. NPDC059783]|uniref:hypothetical protein n=1 Tax=Streptomyces sp. NPDC059783 TaxID=3346944 RepID=UPI00364F1605